MTLQIEDYTIEIKAKQTPTYADPSDWDKKYNKKALISFLYHLCSVYCDAEQGANARGHKATATAHKDEWRQISDFLDTIDPYDPTEEWNNMELLRQVDN